MAINNSTLATTFTVRDEMSSAIQKMAQNVNILMHNYQQLDNTMEKTSTINPFEGVDVGASTKINIAERAQSAFNQSLNVVANRLGVNTTAQHMFTGAIQGSTGAMKGLLMVASPMVLMATTLMGALGSMQAVDKLTGLQARLGLIVDDLNTVESLNDKIYLSAQRSRGSYADMADNVAKLGMLASNAFNNNDEVVMFVEQLDKQFKVAGTGAQEATSAMYQLSQAMASGVLQGDEFRSIRENAPMLVQAIAKELDVSISKVRELSSEGLITSDVIKRALINPQAMEEVKQRFDAMPLQFGEAMTIISNITNKTFQGVMQRVASLTESGGFQKFYAVIANGIVFMSEVTNLAFDGFALLGDVIGWTFGLIESVISLYPMFIGGLVGYATWLGIINARTIATWMAERVLQTTFMVGVGISIIKNKLIATKNLLMGISLTRTKMLTTATALWNAVLMMNPIGLVIALIVGLIAVFGALYLRTVDVREMIADAFATMADMGGKSINTLIGWLNALIGIMNEGGEMFGKMFGFDYKKIETVGKLDTSNWGDLTRNFVTEFDVNKMFSMPNVTGALTGGTGDVMARIEENTRNTSENSKGLKSAVEEAFDSVEDLRQLAEIEGVSNLTRQDIKIEVVNHNNVKNGTDVDDLGERMGAKLLDAISKSKEG